MNETPEALLIRFPGTNCDVETSRALREAGFSTRTEPVSELTRESLNGVRLVVFSGGFSYGDYIMAGRIAQLVTDRRIDDALRGYVDGGGYVLGICNGFQILTKLGLLPECSLIDNTSGRFQCRWVKLRNRQPDNAFLRELPDTFELPIAHAEGRLVARPGKAQEYLDRGLATLTYEGDVNGSELGIAGMQDESGRVFGLMPHPERFLYPEHHYDPDWNERPDHGWGHSFFRSIWRETSGATRLIA